MWIEIYTNTLIRKLYSCVFDYDLSQFSCHVINRKSAFKALSLRILTRLILSTYLLLMLSSAIPVFVDLMAHTFWKKEHLQLTHEMKGKYHVAAELLKMQKQAHKSKTTNTIKYSLKGDRCALHEPIDRFISSFRISNMYAVLRFLYTSAGLTPEYRPPRISLA